MCATDIINCVAGIIGLITSIVAICISISSAKRQYKIDLFNKRISYYYACDIICACCITDMEDVVPQRFENLGIDIKGYDVEGAQFLFEEETAEFISDIFSKWTYFCIIAHYIKNYSNNTDKNEEEFKDNKKRYEETQIFFSEARKQLLTKFEKYLKITN